MNKEEIARFIHDNRAVAQAQAQRWEGVDPSRLLQALDYLEQMVGQPAIGAGVKMFPRQLALSPQEPWVQGVGVCIELEATLDIPTAERLVETIKAQKNVGVLF